MSRLSQFLSVLIFVSASTTFGAESKTTHSTTLEFGYSGSGDLTEGTLGLGETETHSTRLRHVMSRQIGRRLSWRFGGEWERLGFGVPAGAPMPNTVHGLNLHLGTSIFFSRKSFLQLEVDPGIYSDLEDVDFGDLNAPISARWIYLQNENLQWVVAAIGNPKSELPIVGGVGVRWKFAEDWTLDLILPNPQVRYQVNDRLSVHAGGGFRGGAYRVAEDFGTRIGRPQLNDDDVTYREARVGAGFVWQLNEKISAAVDGGWLIDRRFAYENARLQLNGDGAPFFQLALRARF